MNTIACSSAAPTEEVDRERESEKEAGGRLIAALLSMGL